MSSLKQGLIKRGGLDNIELREIQHLAALCNKRDRTDLKLNWSILRSRPKDQINDFLFYYDGYLVGFLALFVFNQQEGEISGMVHPEHRGRNIFKTLLKAAREEGRDRGLPSLLLIVEQASYNGQEVVHRLPVTHDHSEYKMVLEQPRLPETFNERLLFRPATVEDIPVMAQITAQAFEIPDEDEVNWYTAESFSQSNRLYFVGEVDGVVVGKVDVNLSEDAGFILGLAVRPEHQGRGYGRQILARTVQEIYRTGRQNISLEVSTVNKQALSLYQSCGFKETGSYDYYRLPLDS
jgi:ribosomal protein S18 acetylase RimI-like enzyme